MIRAAALLLLASCASATFAQCQASTFQKKVCMAVPTSIAKYTNLSDSATGCCELCQQNSLCYTFTMNHNNDRCFLHGNSASTYSKKGNCTSAVIRSKPTPAPAPTPGPSPAPKGAKNVLFLIADDLRPQLSKAYGKTFMHTPNIDAFTDTALVFDWAYTNMAICSASRNSFLSGRVPDKTRTWNFIDDFREGGADWVTMPQFFKENGYTTLGHGKTYHPGHPSNNDEPKSWSQDQPYVGLTTTRCTGKGKDGHVHGGGNFCPDAVSAPNMFSDHNTTLSAIDTIQRVTTASKVSGKPWFIAMGWHYPHQQWHTPQWAMDKYPDAQTMPPPKNSFSPKVAPPPSSPPLFISPLFAPPPLSISPTTTTFTFTTTTTIATTTFTTTTIATTTTASFSPKVCTD
jgi:hypothetical protein